MKRQDTHAENNVHNEGSAVMIPWQCFTKQNQKMCSCTIISRDYVLVRSSCFNNGEPGEVQVHAGASNSFNSDQIVHASLLATSEPPPEGVVALKLEPQLNFNEYVSEQATESSFLSFSSNQSMVH